MPTFVKGRAREGWAEGEAELSYSPNNETMFDLTKSIGLSLIWGEHDGPLCHHIDHWMCHGWGWDLGPASTLHLEPSLKGADGRRLSAGPTSWGGKSFITEGGSGCWATVSNTVHLLQGQALLLHACLGSSSPPPRSWCAYPWGREEEA